MGALCVWQQPQIISLVPSEGCLTSFTPNIWLDVQRGCFSSDFCPDMLQKQLLKTTVKANVFEFEQHSPTACPEQALLQCGPSALLHTLQCYRIRDMIQLPALFVAEHENVYGFVLFSCFGKMPFKKCHLPLPTPFTYIIREVWVKCPSRSWTAVTSKQAAHGGSSWCQSSASEGHVMGMRQTAPFAVSLPSGQGYPFQLLLSLPPHPRSVATHLALSMDPLLGSDP